MADSGTPLCQAEGCENPGTMRCPTCRELGLPDQNFCSEACFKGSWESHKAIHKAAKLIAQQAAGARGVKVPRAFAGFSFSGRLRPAEVSPMAKVPPGIPKPDYALTGVPTSENKLRGSNVIPVLTPDEVESMRRACRLGREILDIGSALLRPGVTGDDIDRAVFAACVERGVYPSPLNYHGFPKSLCVSVNEVICHGIPDARPLEDGDIVNLDVSIFTAEGFHSDLNETFLVGAVDAKGQQLVKAAYECLRAAVSVCKPGVMYRDLGAVIKRAVDGIGPFSIVQAYCGHGVGRMFHCAPNVPHYPKNKAVGMMKKGHVFTIEPMINEGSSHDMTWPDQWTSTTVDGKRSAQFEHTLLVTETGVEVLTSRVGVADVTCMPPWEAVDLQRPLKGDGAATANSPSASRAAAVAVTAAAIGGEAASASLPAADSAKE